MRISEIQELAQMLSQLTDEERKLLERNEAKARKANGMPTVSIRPFPIFIS